MTGNIPAWRLSFGQISQKDLNLQSNYAFLSNIPGACRATAASDIDLIAVTNLRLTKAREEALRIPLNHGLMPGLRIMVRGCTKAFETSEAVDRGLMDSGIWCLPWLAIYFILGATLAVSCLSEI